MNNIIPRRFEQINWSAIVMFALGFWLSSSLVFDCLVIPGLLRSGMMNQEGFASVGYTIFGAFNHLELLCGAIILAGILVLNYTAMGSVAKFNGSTIMAGILLVIAVLYTYILIPQMSGWGLCLSQFSSTQSISVPMETMHIIYWSLEATKLLLATSLLSKFYRNSCHLV